MGRDDVAQSPSTITTLIRAGVGRLWNGEGLALRAALTP